MDKYENFLEIAELIRYNFGDNFKFEDLDNIYSIYKKLLRQEQNSGGKDIKNNEDHVKKVKLNMKINDDIVFISYEQDLSEIYDENFADGNSLTDYAKTHVKTEWLINGKKIVCDLEAFYEVSCAGHSGGVEGIEKSEYEIEYSERINYGEKTELCEEYIIEISKTLSWKNKESCLDDLIESFIVEITYEENKEEESDEETLLDVINQTL